MANITPKTEVKYEFFEYTEIAGGKLQVTLPQRDFASITFQVIGASGYCTINNIYSLINYLDATTPGGTNKRPWELTLNNNENEIDTTQYQLLIGNNATVNIIIKYIVKNN